MALRDMLLILAGLAALAHPAAAQDAATPEQETPPAETADDTPPGPATPEQLQEIYPLPEEAQPREIVKAEHQDWQVRCNAADETQCFMYQLAKDSEGRTVAEFTLIRLPDGGQVAAGATVVTGLGVALPRGVALTIDSANPLGYPYLYCVPAGCFSRLGLTAATVTRLKRGAEAKLTVVSITDPETPIVGILSLNGFTAAYDALTPIQQ